MSQLSTSQEQIIIILFHGSSVDRRHPCGPANREPLGVSARIIKRRQMSGPNRRDSAGPTNYGLISGNNHGKMLSTDH